MNATRVYLPHGSVAHLLDPMDSPNSSFPAGCGASPRLAGDSWRGTGSQHEHDVARDLPTCRRCEAK